MKDILIKHDNRNYVECELDGLQLTYTYSDEPKNHIVGTLKSAESYNELKRDLYKIYYDFDGTIDGYINACMFLDTAGCHEKYFTDEHKYSYYDIRDREEMYEYLDEATDKVWLMRNCLISRRIPKYEVGRPAMERIFDKYKDIPKNGYSDWECGYWNGIMGALRWVLGDEKDFLDT